MARASSEEKKRSPFAIKLKELRTAAGLSQVELAEKAGMHPMALAKIEQGGESGRGKSPSWETVEKLANALGVSCEEFRVSAPKKRKEK